MSKKIGRNDPCPCGSGKKYKSCCWKKDQPKSSVDLKKRSLSVMKSGLAEKISQIGSLHSQIKPVDKEKGEAVAPPEPGESLEP